MILPKFDKKVLKAVAKVEQPVASRQTNMTYYCPASCFCSHGLGGGC